MIYIIVLIITIFNIGISVISENIPAIFGWATSACWLLVLIKKEFDE